MAGDCSDRVATSASGNLFRDVAQTHERQMAKADGA